MKLMLNKKRKKETAAPDKERENETNAIQVIYSNKMRRIYVYNIVLCTKRIHSTTKINLKYNCLKRCAQLCCMKIIFGMADMGGE